MKYDIIVVGGGPGGLATALTAARDGLKVLLVERKKNLPEINRLCGQFANINMISVTGIYKYGYSEPFHIEIGTNKTTVHWPAIDFSTEYTGPLKPYLNYIHFSVSGHKLYRIKDRFFGFYWEKEALLSSLLAQAERAGAKIITGAIARSLDNTPDGVKIEIETTTGLQSFKAKKAVAADGKDSKIAEQLGVFKDRCTSNLPTSGIGFIVEDVDTDWGINSWLCFTIPSLSPIGNLWMFQITGNRYVVGTSQTAGSSASEATAKFMKLPFFEPWFRKCKIVKKLGFTSKKRVRPLLEPIVNNILILGEAAGLGETSNPGAIACGYQAAKAILKEISGEPGFVMYCKWWQKAFEGNDPQHTKAVARFFSLNSLCTDEEVDYLYQAYKDEIGVPAITIAKDLDRIKGIKPELYEKLKNIGITNGLNGMKLEYSDLLERKG